MSILDDTPRIQTPLTAQDRCDSCGAGAKVRVMLKNGDLLFCQHHYNKHASAIENLQVTVDEEAEVLEAEGLIELEPARPDLSGQTN